MGSTISDTALDNPTLSKIMRVYSNLPDSIHCLEVNGLSENPGKWIQNIQEVLFICCKTRGRKHWMKDLATQHEINPDTTKATIKLT